MFTSRTSLATLLAPILLLAPLTAKADNAHIKKSGTLSVDASLSHATLPNYSSSEVHASIKIEARDFVSERRAPLNVALVMDRSSSMSGEKIHYSRLAALRLVEQLGESDRISVITYGADVTVEVTSLPVTAENRPRIQRAIEGIEPNGFTNLSGGFEKGCELVSNTIQEASVNRVILMSDGQANQGITDPFELSKMASGCLEKGVSLTTVGLGLDYNEDLMTQMAVAGAGNYHFISDETQMAAVFAQEAAGLTATVAKQARLTLTLAPGVELLKVHGYKYREKGNTVTIPLSEFSSRQKKDVLVKLSVSAQKSGERPVLGVKLSYEDVLNAREADARLSLAAAVSADKKEVAARMDRDVVSHAQKVEVAETMQEAMSEYERGNSAQAQKMIASQRAAIKANRAQYDFADDAEAYDRVDEELDQMSQSIEQNAPDAPAARELRKAKKKRAYDISNVADAF